MFPYMSPYMYLFNRYGYGMGSQNQYGMQPWDIDSGPGGRDSEFRGFGSSAGAGTGTGTQSTDPVTGRRRPPASSWIALGTSLLEAAPRGDWAGGLARGAAGFSEQFERDKEIQRRNAIEAQEERRRQAAERRAEEQERDRNRSADLSFEQGTAELDAFKEQQSRGRTARERTGKSADQMVAEINSLAAANPSDAKLQIMAKRAAGYALGEDSDLNKLADLHEQMTGQAFRQQDLDFETEAGIGRAKKEIAAGVRSDPAADDRRADAGLAISREHLNLSKERSAQDKEGLTDLQAYDRLEKKVKEKLDRRYKAHMDSYGREPTPAQREQWRKEALVEAMSEMEQRVNQVYNFTRDGRFMQEP